MHHQGSLVIPIDLYYSFLNLGLTLTATAGSDVPWGNTLGMARMYVYTGSRFEVDAWFDGVRKGHTFVINAPILELTVNGRIPGSRIEANPGERLHVQVRAQNPPGIAPLENLEVIALGEVLHSVGDQGEVLKLDFELVAEKSLWIAARCSGKFGEATPGWTPGDRENPGDASA